jgi:tetratricopeptide (TPR) repeat protein
LSDALSRQAWQNYIDQKSGYERARQIALKAISLDSTYAPAYLQLGDSKLYYEFDWQGAEQAYRKALHLEPTNANIITGLGDHKNALGHCDEAEQFYKKALIYNPLKPIIYLDLGNALSCQGRYSEAISIFKKILEIHPQFQRAHMYIGKNYILMNKPGQALSEMEKENMEIFKIFGLALAYHALGRKTEADEKIKQFTETFGNEWSFLLAELHAFRGEKQKALDYLEIAYQKRESWLFWIKGEPLLKSVYDESRYKAILQKMNLPVE